MEVHHFQAGSTVVLEPKGRALMGKGGAAQLGLCDCERCDRRAPRWKDCVIWGGGSVMVDRVVIVSTGLLLIQCTRMSYDGKSE